MVSIVNSRLPLFVKPTRNSTCLPAGNSEEKKWRFEKPRFQRIHRIESHRSPIFDVDGNVGFVNNRYKSAFTDPVSLILGVSVSSVCITDSWGSSYSTSTTSSSSIGSSALLNRKPSRITNKIVSFLIGKVKNLLIATHHYWRRVTNKRRSKKN